MKIWLLSHHPKRLKRGYIKAFVKPGKDSNEIFVRKVWYVWKQVNVIETSLQVGQQISKWQTDFRDKQRPGEPRTASTNANNNDGPLTIKRIANLVGISLITFFIIYNYNINNQYL